MPTDEMFRKFDEAAERYRAAFGEQPPMMELPEDLVDALALVEAAIAAGEPYAAPTEIDGDAVLY